VDRIVFDRGTSRALLFELLEAGGNYSLVAMSGNEGRVDFSFQSSGQPVEVFPLLPLAIYCGIAE
jgi:hypothetical protein